MKISCWLFSLVSGRTKNKAKAVHLKRKKNFFLVFLLELIRNIKFRKEKIITLYIMMDVLEASLSININLVFWLEN